MEIIKETCYKGTRILLGDEKRDILNNMISILKDNGFSEISIPIIQYQEIFNNKVGEENNNQIFNFQDRGNRNICLSPEYTAVIQELSKTTFKYQKDIKVFYVLECFRGEKPQAGRYRQFTQLGVEIINPTKDYILVDLSYHLLLDFIKYVYLNFKINEYTDIYKMFNINTNVSRGLDYYKNGKGFEITCEKLGSSKQICGGGEYDGGVGFAIGIDRLLTLLE